MISSYVRTVQKFYFSFSSACRRQSFVIFFFSKQRIQFASVHVTIQLENSANIFPWNLYICVFANESSLLFI